MEPKIGIITALPKEYAAVEAMLSNCRTKSVPGHGAGREYCVGTIPAIQGGDHLVILKLADVGNNIAAIRASQMLMHFPSIDYILMVGIAGGIPNPDKCDEHVRLGDIVVSNKKGIIQYDFDKEEKNFTEIRSSSIPPDAHLLESVSLLQVEELKLDDPVFLF